MLGLCQLSYFPRKKISAERLTSATGGDGEIYLSEQRIRDIKAGKELTFRREMRRKDGSYLRVEVSSRMLADGRFHAIVRELEPDDAAGEA